MTGLIAREIVGPRTPLDTRSLPTSAYAQFEAYRRVTGHHGGVNYLIVDGSRFITGSNDCLVKVWSTENGRLLHALRGHSEAVSAVAVDSVNGIVAAGAAHSRKVRLWKLTTGELLAVLKAPEEGSVEGLKFTGRGQERMSLMAVGSSFVVVWQYSTDPVLSFGE